MLLRAQSLCDDGADEANSGLLPGISPLHVVADQCDHLIVETGLAATGTHCHLPADSYSTVESHGFSGLHLRLRVRRRDLLSVTTRDIRVAFGDGSSVELRPAVAVRPLDFADHREIIRPYPTYRLDDFRSTRLHLQIPREAIGLSYEPASIVASAPPSPATPHVSGAMHLGPNGLVRVGDQSVDLSYAVVTGPDTGTGSPIVTWTDMFGCATVRANAKDAVLRPNASQQGALIGRVVGARTWTVKQGTPLTWPDGRAAGETVADTLFESAPSATGGSACFVVLEHVADYRPHGRLRVCMPMASVSDGNHLPVERRRAPASAAGFRRRLMPIPQSD